MTGRTRGRVGPLGPPFARCERRWPFLNEPHSAFRDVPANLDGPAGQDDVDGLADRASRDRAGPHDVADPVGADDPAYRGDASVCREADPVAAGRVVGRLGASRLAPLTYCLYRTRFPGHTFVLCRLA